MQPKEHNYLLKYIESLQSQGRYTFSLEEAKKEFKRAGSAQTHIKATTSKGVKLDLGGHDNLDEDFERM